MGITNSTARAFDLIRYNFPLSLLTVLPNSSDPYDSRQAHQEPKGACCQIVIHDATTGFHNDAGRLG
jgi:hypothetical protein